jgi:hypothetical protein
MGECVTRVLQILKPFHRDLRLNVCLVRRSQDLVDPHGHFHMLHWCCTAVRDGIQCYTHYDGSALTSSFLAGACTWEPSDFWGTI